MNFFKNSRAITEFIQRSNSVLKQNFQHGDSVDIISFARISKPLITVVLLKLYKSINSFSEEAFLQESVFSF